MWAGCHGSRSVFPRSLPHFYTVKMRHNMAPRICSPGSGGNRPCDPINLRAGEGESECMNGSRTASSIEREFWGNVANVHVRLCATAPLVAFSVDACASTATVIRLSGAS